MPNHVTEKSRALSGSLARRSSESLVFLSGSHTGLIAALLELSLVAHEDFWGVVDPGTS